MDRKRERASEHPCIATQPGCRVKKERKMILRNHIERSHNSIHMCPLIIFCRTMNRTGCGRNIMSTGLQSKDAVQVTPHSIWFRQTCFYHLMPTLAPNLRPHSNWCFRFPIMSARSRSTYLFRTNIFHVPFKLAPIYYSRWRRKAEAPHTHTQNSLPSHLATYSWLQYYSFFLSAQAACMLCAALWPPHAPSLCPLLASGEHTTQKTREIAHMYSGI